MCGIAGIVNSDPARDSAMRRMLDALAHRGPDGEGIYQRRARNARASPPVDHRPRRRAAAAAQRGSLDPAGLQWRDLQLSRTASRARTQRPYVSDSQRLRGHHRAVRALRRPPARSPARHVRVRAVGREASTPARRARPSRAEAAVLHARRARLRLRIGDQGAARFRRPQAADESRRARSIPRPAAGRCAAVDVRRHSQAAAGTFAGARSRRHATHRALLAAGAGAEAHGHRRPAVRRARGEDRGVAASAPGQRRAGGCIPQRRHGFEPAGRDARAQARRSPAADVHDGARLPTLRRGPGRARGGPAVRHRASRRARQT